MSIAPVNFCDNQTRYARMHGRHILARVDLIRYRSFRQIPSTIKQHAFYNCTRYPLDKSPVCVGLASQLSIAAIRLSSTSLQFITDIVQRIHFFIETNFRNRFTVDERSIDEGKCFDGSTFTNVSPNRCIFSMQQEVVQRSSQVRKKCDKKKRKIILPRELYYILGSHKISEIKSRFRGTAQVNLSLGLDDAMRFFDIPPLGYSSVRHEIHGANSRGNQNRQRQSPNMIHGTLCRVRG